MAIQIRRGTNAEWESNNSNIVAGEPAVAMDSERMFVGTGSGTYMELANIDVLADPFDSSASYVVGDFVAYHGKVYKFNTNHSGAWNASHVDEVALADALDALGDGVYTKAEADALLALKANESEVAAIRTGADGTVYANAGNAINSQFKNLNRSGFVTEPVESIWMVGYWAIADGTSHTDGDWMKSVKYLDEDIAKISTDSDLYLFLQAWAKEGGTYIGTWNGSAFTKTYVPSAYKKEISLEQFRIDYPTYNFTISLKASNSRYIFPFIDGLNIDITRSSIISAESSINALNNASFIRYKMSDVYERGVVSAEQNMYIAYPEEDPTRARAKQEYIQEVPTGATSVTVGFNNASLANGKYKIGWAFYTDNYVQIVSSIMGWYTSSAQFTKTVPANAKYFMLYYATNSASEITLDEIDNAKNRIIFNNSPINYAEALLVRPVSDEVNEMRNNVSTIQEDLVVNADNETFIYSVNHRGYSTEAPENTLPAYILSKKKGFVYAECDVEFTSDGVAVLLHDSTINRTARNANGSAISSTIDIGDITYAQALNYDFGIWKGEKWAGTKIPTFDEFILLCKKLSLHPFIELKDVVNGTYWTDARIEQIADSIKSVGMENHVSFISFSVSALQKISVYFPKARLGLGFEGTYSEANFANYITNAQTLLDDDREVIATVQYSSMTDALYSMLTTASIKPLVWTVNTESVVLNLDETVVGVLSDSLNAGKIILDELIASIS